MRLRRTAALVCALGIGVGVAACGGDDGDEPAAAQATSGDAAPAVSGDLLERLPDGAPLDGTREGDPRSLPSARAFVDALYAEGDPAKDAAVGALEAGGFAGAVLRDDPGTDPQEGVALHRMYVLEMGDDVLARAEVLRAAQEVLQAQGGGVQDTGSFPVEGIPGATGVLVVQEVQGEALVAVVVIFPLGPYVYGFQTVAVGDPFLVDRGQLVAIARERYEAGT